MDPFGLSLIIVGFLSAVLAAVVQRFLRPILHRIGGAEAEQSYYKPWVMVPMFVAGLVFMVIGVIIAVS